MTWKEAVDNYFQTHETMNDDNRAWLRKHVVMDAPLISQMTVEQLEATFNDAKGRINNVLLIRTLVWQCIGLVLCGDEDPVNGNLRGFWYSFVDPIYEQFGLYARLLKSPDFRTYVRRLATASDNLEPRRLARITHVQESYITDLSERVLKQYVAQGIFRYQGVFKFENANAGWALTGEGHASLVFAVEKQSLFKTLSKPLYQELGITVIASRGYPSLTALEFLGDELRRKGIKNVGLAVLCDYDDDGWGIARTYRKHFETVGFGIKNFTILTSLELFTAKALAEKARKLDETDPAVKAWFAETGGINGECKGIRVNHAGKPRIRKAVKAWYKEQTEKKADDGN